MTSGQAGQQGEAATAEVCSLRSGTCRAQGGHAEPSWATQLGTLTGQDPEGDRKGSNGRERLRGPWSGIGPLRAPSVPELPNGYVWSQRQAALLPSAGTPSQSVWGDLRGCFERHGPPSGVQPHPNKLRSSQFPPTQPELAEALKVTTPTWSRLRGKLRPGGRKPSVPSSSGATAARVAAALCPSQPGVPPPPRRGES